jgi:hypothetical protein
MSIEEKIFYRLRTNDAVSALVGTRIYPIQLPPGRTLPAITYTRVSTVRGHCLGGPSGRLRPRIQIDCWADTYSGARTLADKVRLCLDGFLGAIDGESNIGGIKLDGEYDGFETGVGYEDLEPGTPRVILDFIVPHFEATS